MSLKFFAAARINEIPPISIFSINSESVDFDATVAANLASTTGAATGALRNSVNNHAWYGLVTNFKTELTEDIDFNMGLDLRTYKGTHFRQLTNLLGAFAAM